MSVTISDPAVLEQLAAAGPEVELTDPTGRSLGVLTYSKGEAFLPGSYSSDAPEKLPVMTQARLDAILAAAKKVGDDPLFEDYLNAIAEYRREHNTFDEAE